MAGALAPPGARESRVHGGRGVTAPAPQLRAPTGLAMLLAAAVALLVGSGVSYYFLEARPAASAHAVPVDALYNLALDAGSTLARFAARAQRLQLDVSTLTQGTGDAGQAAQRIAEGSDYLGQVITGLMGGNSALALPRVTAPEPARHLKALDGIYTGLSAA